MSKKDVLAKLFLTFAKIGFFTFGGGYAMISVIGHECVEKRRWITQEEMTNVTVIAESTPGPIAINCATFVGYKQAGFPGAALATLGIVLPSFLCIWIISLFLDGFLEIPIIANAFLGIKVAVGILILDAGITMLKKMKKKPLPLSLLSVSAVFLLVGEVCAFHVSTVVLMLTGGLISLALCCLNGGKAGAGK